MSDNKSRAAMILTAVLLATIYGAIRIFSSNYQVFYGSDQGPQGLLNILVTHGVQWGDGANSDWCKTGFASLNLDAVSCQEIHHHIHMAKVFVMGLFAMLVLTGLRSRWEPVSRYWTRISLAVLIAWLYVVLLEGFGPWLSAVQRLFNL